ncbi:MAG TPA: tetratricopeptide repeat protein [Vulgatibacter sp.]
MAQAGAAGTGGAIPLPGGAVPPSQAGHWAIPLPGGSGLPPPVPHGAIPLPGAGALRVPPVIPAVDAPRGTFSVGDPDAPPPPPPSIPVFDDPRGAFAVGDPGAPPPPPPGAPYDFRAPSPGGGFAGDFGAAAPGGFAHDFGAPAPGGGFGGDVGAPPAAPRAIPLPGAGEVHAASPPGGVPLPGYGDFRAAPGTGGLPPPGIDGFHASAPPNAIPLPGDGQDADVDLLPADLPSLVGFDLADSLTPPPPGAPVDEFDFGDFAATAGPASDPSRGSVPLAPPDLPPLTADGLFGGIDPLPADEPPSASGLPDLEMSIPPLANEPQATSAASDLVRSFVMDDEPPAAEPQAFHVRRKSGKRMGPFDEETLARMVRQDQLEGSEEVSSDGETWTPLADLPAVGAALQSRPLIKRAAPPPAPVLQRGVVVAEEPSARPTLERPPPAAETAVAGPPPKKVRKRSASSRRGLALAGGGILGAALLGAGAHFFLGMEAEAPPAQEDPQQAAHEEAARREMEQRERKRAEAGRVLEAARAALVKGEPDEARTLLGEAFAADTVELLSKPQRAEGALLRGELARLARDAAGVEAAFREALAADEGAKGARLALGEHLLSRHRAADAVEVLRPASGGDDPSLLEALVRAHLSSGNVTSAEGVVQPLEKRAPKGVPVPLLRGLILEASGKGAEAIAAFEKAAAEAPALAAPQVALVSAWLRSGDPGKEKAAIARIDAIEREAKDAKDADAKATEYALPAFTPQQRARIQLALGEHRLSKGELPAALRAFTTAAALDPAEARGPAGRGAVRLAEGDSAAARTEFEEALAINDASVEALVGLGTIAWREGNLEAALDLLGKASTFTPMDPKVGVRLAAVQVDAAEYAKAAKTVEAVLALDDSLAEAHAVQASVLLGRKDPFGAETAIRKAIALEQSNPRWQLRLARILDAEEAPARAASAYRDVLALDPGNADALEGLGKALLALGGTAEGVRSLEAALAKDPARTHLTQAIVDGWLRSRNFKKAIEAIERQRKAGGAKGLSFQLARALQEQGRTDQAIAQFQKAIAEDPADAKAHRYLGFAYKEKNQIRKAVEAFQTYLAKAPDADDRAEIEDEIATLR